MVCRGGVRRRRCVHGFDGGCVRLDLAGRRAGAAAVLRRSGPVRGRPAPGRRHRGDSGQRRGRTGRRHRLVRRLRTGRRPSGHDHDRRWLRRDAAPARCDERRARPHRHRGSRGRQRRRERRCIHRAATRPSRRAGCRRPERIRRSARSAAGASARTASASAGVRAAGARSGSSHYRRGPAAAADTHRIRNCRAGRGRVPTCPGSRSASYRPPRDHPTRGSQAASHRTPGEGHSAGRSPRAPDACRNGRVHFCAPERPHTGENRDCESRKTAGNRVTPGGRREPTHQGEAGCTAGSAAANPAGRRSSGRSAPERRPACAIGRARPGGPHPPAHDPRARRWSRSAGQAQACAYHL